MVEPTHASHWLELSKLLQSLGRDADAFTVVKRGLVFAKEPCEALLVRAVTVAEDMGMPQRAREFLGTLKRYDIGKVWRTVLHGAGLEARQGNLDVAATVFDHLMQNVPWYGPIYAAAFEVEFERGRKDRARRIVERGLKEIPRYGPLWFGR